MKCDFKQCPWFTRIKVIKEIDNMFLLVDDTTCTLKHDGCGNIKKGLNK